MVFPTFDSLIAFWVVSLGFNSSTTETKFKSLTNSRNAYAVFDLSFTIKIAITKYLIKKSLFHF